MYGWLSAKLVNPVGQERNQQGPFHPQTVS
jgi:hypothetical protein